MYFVPQTCKGAYQTRKSPFKPSISLDSNSFTVQDELVKQDDWLELCTKLSTVIVASHCQILQTCYQYWIDW